MIFFFKLKTANEMRISDGSSDVCSSVLADLQHRPKSAAGILVQRRAHPVERFGQHGDERAPLVGKRESSRQAVEEAHAEPAFKLRDMMADGPLADAKLDRGAGEIEVTRRRFEGAQGVQGKLDRESVVWGKRGSG